MPSAKAKYIDPESGVEKEVKCFTALK